MEIISSIRTTKGGHVSWSVTWRHEDSGTVLAKTRGIARSLDQAELIFADAEAMAEFCRRLASSASRRQSLF